MSTATYALVVPGTWTSAADAVAERHRTFAAVEAAGSSPTYEALSMGIARDASICRRLGSLPLRAQQPNLLYAAVRYSGGATDAWPVFRGFVEDEWVSIEQLLLTRRTQTNEVARSAVLLPLLSAIEGPVALVEVGASAGLCLYPDRLQYTYRTGFESHVVGGPSVVELDIACHGDVPLPTRVPDVVWRAGLDLNPLDVGDPDDLAWLQACVWPEHPDRLDRLVAASSIAVADPPLLVEGDLLEATTELVASAPRGATTIVFHSAVLAYVARETRRDFAALLGDHEVVWISNEAPGVVEGLRSELVTPPGAAAQAHFVVGRSGHAVCIADPHGSWIRWP